MAAWTTQLPAGGACHTNELSRGGCGTYTLSIEHFFHHIKHTFYAAQITLIVKPTLVLKSHHNLASQDINKITQLQ